MAQRDAKQALLNLTELAMDQGGCFTAKQAEKAGFEYPHLTYHVHRGNFERVDHGLYRIPMIPLDEYNEYTRLSLWSRGRDAVRLAVVSHELALALHELSDMLPGKVHLTVPRTFREQPRRNCLLHKGDIGPKNVAARNGFRVIAPLRTLIDVAAENTVPGKQLDLAVSDAVDKGMVTLRKLKDAAAQADPDSRLHACFLR